MILTGLSSYLARFGSGLVILITIPVVKEALDAELFGVWMMMSSLIVFFGFADLGVGNSLLNYISDANAKQEYARLFKACLTAYYIVAAVSLMIVIGWVSWVYLATDPTDVAGEIAPRNKPEVKEGFHVFFITLAVAVPLGLVQKIRLGLQEGYWNGIFLFSCSVVTLVAVPKVLSAGLGLSGLVLATLGVQVVGHAANTIALVLSRRTLFSNLNYSTSEPLPVRELMNKGFIFFLLQISAALAYQSDAIVIVQVLGQEVYGDYAVVQKFFFLITSIVLASIAGLWPAFGDAISIGDYRWVKRMFFRICTITFLVASSCVLFLSYYIELTLELWLGMIMTPSLPLLWVLSLWVLTESIANVAAALMNAAEILKPQIVVAVLMSGVAFWLKWHMVAYFGDYGATLATLCAYFAISVPVQWYLIKQLFDGWQIEAPRH